MTQHAADEKQGLTDSGGPPLTFSVNAVARP